MTRPILAWLAIAVIIAGTTLGILVAAGVLPADMVERILDVLVESEEALGTPISELTDGAGE